MNNSETDEEDIAPQKYRGGLLVSVVMEIKEDFEKLHARLLGSYAWRRIRSALNEDTRTLDRAGAAAFIPVRIALTLLIVYYGDETCQLSADELARLLPEIATEENNKNPTKEVEKPASLLAEPTSLARPFKFSEFVRAAKKVNPLYAILPALFVAWVMLLDWWIRKRLATATNLRLIWNACLAVFLTRFRDPRWLRDFTLDLRPLLLSWLCLVPTAVILMMGYCSIQAFIAYIFPRKPVCGVHEKFGQPCLILTQNIEHQAYRADNFYSSGWFNAIVAIPYVLGIPTVITLWIYYHGGIDAQLGYPSFHKHFFNNFVVIGSYLYCLGTCITLLFFRSYFGFALNFDSREYDIEIYPDLIKKLPIKGWFFDFLMTVGREMPAQIAWSEVEKIKFATNRLDTEQTTDRNPFMMLVQKITSVYESLAERMRTAPDFICVESKTGTCINIQLWNLSYRQKLDLFHAFRSYCPAILLDEKVQKALVGSSIMKEARYTQIWFDVLTAGVQQHSDGDLQCLHKLRNGKYEVKSKIGAGGQATVYEVETDTGDLVVLKEFRLTTDESLDAQMESAKEFENESAILSQLKHESIVKMLDIFYEGCRVYIVLERVHGKTLRQVVCEDGVMNEESILGYTRQMVDILKYLHQQEPPVVHRDFTPENIIVQPDGRLKLIDFSIAQSTAGKKVRGECAGKHSYTPPEQFAGNACPQSDIYALGATLYFLATGQDAEPITKSRLPHELATRMPGIDNIIAHCTELDMDCRYSSVEWLLADLDEEDQTVYVETRVGREKVNSY